MKNFKKIVLASFLVLMALVTLYFFVRVIPKKDEVSRIYSEMATKNISKIKVTKEKEEPFFISNKEGVSGLENIPLNKSLIEQLHNFLYKIPAQRIFKPKEDLKEYGLSSPSFVFEVFGEKERFKLKVGNKTADGSGYYVNLDEGKANGKIAVIDSGNIEQILVGKLFYIDLNLVHRYEKTYGEDKKYNGDGVRECVIERKGLKDSFKFEVNDEGKVVVKSPKNFKLTEGIEKIVEKAPNLLKAKYVHAVRPSEEELKKCGCQDPALIIRYLIDDKKYTFKIGEVAKVEQLPNYGEEKKDVGTIKYYYVVVEGIDVIFVVHENALPWLEIGSKK